MKIRPIVNKIAKSLEKDKDKWKFKARFLSTYFIYEINNAQNNKPDFYIELENVLSSFYVNINGSNLDLTKDEHDVIWPPFCDLIKIPYKNYKTSLKRKLNRKLNENIQLALETLK